MKNVFMVFVLFTLGCASSGPRTPDKPKSDASAQFACRDFVNAVTETQKGLLTEGELREKIKGVYANARLADDLTIRSAAEAMLREITAGTTEGGIQAFESFAKACRTIQ